ncbi:septum formation protein MAF homologue, putative [Hepatocystis sp. ex Piliocolobus tephrosceles]|nr:septum formation protein MAF homologue, putative [Hepatocystis sp. ex Piliocolobus tephrosceles]
MQNCSHLIGLGNIFKEKKKKWILLASKSPRRIELIKLMGVKNLYVCESGFEENLDKTKFAYAEDYVKKNALEKGLNVVEHIWFNKKVITHRENNKSDMSNDNTTENEKNTLKKTLKKTLNNNLDNNLDKNLDNNLDKNLDKNLDNNLDNNSNNYHMTNLNSVYEPLPNIIISCDTIVTLNNEIIEKPLNKKHAYEILTKLSGNTHCVYTAVCIFLYETKKEPITFVEKTNVYFDELKEQDINRYLEMQEPYDKAGAYSIQGIGSQFIKKIDGCYYNVMGLPIHKLSKILTKLCLENKF